MLARPDALSGVVTVSPPCPLLVTAEGAAVTGTVTVTDVAENTATFTSPPVKIDKTPPQTTAAATPAPNSAGWNNTDVTVTLTGSESLSGVDHSEYNLDGAGWTAYAGPVAITSVGVHALQYRSVDKAGNVETAQQLTVKTDKTENGPVPKGWTLRAPMPHRGEEPRRVRGRQDVQAPPVLRAGAPRSDATR